MTPLTASEPYQLPRGAKTALLRVRRSYARVKAHSVRGRSAPSQEYTAARADLVEALRALSRLNVPQQVTASALGITRSAVSQWLGQAS